jgi:hypothetical protein
VQLSAVSERTAMVAYATANGTAPRAANDDTQTTGTLTLPVSNDGWREPSETLVLSAPVHATIATGTAWATILDDDGTYRALDPRAALGSWLP